MTPEIHAKLIDTARAAMGRAYAPYSGFQVGAALLLADGQIMTGCNVENASYGATICAERTAIASAVAQGHRDFAAICIMASTEKIITPCGICRQVLSEFGPDMPVICCTNAGDSRTLTVADLLPHSFGAEYL